MKYTIERKANEEIFTPFSVTVNIESYEEYVYFHDKVAPILAKNASMHQFYSDIFRTGHGEIDLANGTI